MNLVAAADGARDRSALTRRGPGPLKSALILAVLAFVAFAAVRLGAPILFPPAIYDGWAVGALITCPVPYVDPAKPPSTAYCDTSLAVWLSAAREGFDRRDPGHAAVVRATLHSEAITHFPAPVGCCDVVVFELADGTVRAIGVKNWIGDDGIIDYNRAAAFDYGPNK